MANTSKDELSIGRSNKPHHNYIAQKFIGSLELV